MRSPLVRATGFILVGLVLAAASACGPVVPDDSYAGTSPTPPVPLGPTPTLVASAQDHPTAIVADGTGVYWIDAGVLNESYDTTSIGGSLMKASLDGSGVTVVAGGLASPTALATDSTNIFFARAGTPSADKPDGSLSSIGKDGSDEKLLVASAYDPTLVAVDDDHLYWVERGYSSSTLKRANKDGSDVLALAHVGTPTRMTIADGAIFLTDTITGSIERVDENDGTSSVLTTDPGCSSSSGCPSGVAVTGGTVYWGAGDAVLQMDESGAGLSVTFAPRVTAGIVADGDALYWADFPQGSGGSAIVRASISSREVTVLAASEGFVPEPLAVGPTAIYWTSVGTQTSDLVGQGDVWMIGK